MKRQSVRSIGGVVVISLLSATLSAQVNTKQLRLELSGPAKAKAGDDVVLKAKITNITDTNLRVLVPEPGYLGYKVSVTEIGTGKEAKLTDFTRSLRGDLTVRPYLVIGKNNSAVLKPNQSYIEEITLKDLYDLQPGRYKVSVEKNGEKVRSNEIVIAVE